MTTSDYTANALCPRVIHDPSKLTVRSIVSLMQIDGSMSWYTQRTTRSASSNRRVTTILLASQMARECLANVLWWTGAMSRKRHSPECPTPMSIDPAMACRTVKNGTLPEVDPSIRSEDRVELTTVLHPVQKVSIAATSPSLRSMTRITSDAAPHSGHSNPFTRFGRTAARTRTLVASCNSSVSASLSLSLSLRSRVNADLKTNFLLVAEVDGCADVDG